MVPEPAPKKAKEKVGVGVAVQDNGLPEGVKILPVGAAVSDKPAAKASPESSPEPASAPAPATASTVGAAISSIIKPRSRMRIGENPPDGADKAKKRKPGRPKAGPLDAPQPVTMDAPAPDALPAAPKITVAPAEPTPAPAAEPTPAPAPAAPPRPRSMSDIAPRRPALEPEADSAPETKKKSKAKKAKPPKPERHHVHKVGVPPLHFGAVLASSFKSRFRPTHLLLASVAALSFAALTAYGVWLLLSGGLPHLATQITSGGLRLAAEAALLAALYYVGRSIGQAAITYGIAREADQRPVPLNRQIGVGINTFARRLVLDLWFAIFELILLALMTSLILSGGSTWPVDSNLQLAALFIAFMVLLYLQTGLALARGLAAVNLTLTTGEPIAAAKLGWQMFSHRFELLGLRFLALTMELILAAPLAAVAVGLILATPANLHMLAALGVGLLALIAGSLFGAGTAAWWVSLYRRIILADHPDQVSSLLSGRQAVEARRGDLTALVSLTTLLIAAVLALPWLKFF